MNVNSKKLVQLQEKVELLKLEVELEVEVETEETFVDKDDFVGDDNDLENCCFLFIFIRKQNDNNFKKSKILKR